MLSSFNRDSALNKSDLICDKLAFWGRKTMIPGADWGGKRKGLAKSKSRVIKTRPVFLQASNIPSSDAPDSASLNN
jgi:hypothetical protein